MWNSSGLETSRTAFFARRLELGLCSGPLDERDGGTEVEVPEFLATGSCLSAEELSFVLIEPTGLLLIERKLGGGEGLEASKRSFKRSMLALLWLELVPPP